MKEARIEIPVCTSVSYTYKDRSPCGERELKFSINTLKQAALLVALHTRSVN